jgi:hypothetical protein
MSFLPPTFNILANIWRSGNAPPAAQDLQVQCNLAFGRRVSSYQGVISTPNEPIMTLLLPPSTDVRGPQCALPDTCVEVPAGTKRYYTIIGLDDSGKGFPNEHRCALLAWTASFGPWPSPVP